MTVWSDGSHLSIADLWVRALAGADDAGLWPEWRALAARPVPPRMVGLRVMPVDPSRLRPGEIAEVRALELDANEPHHELSDMASITITEPNGLSGIRLPVFLLLEEWRPVVREAKTP